MIRIFRHASIARDLEFLTKNHFIGRLFLEAFQYITSCLNKRTSNLRGVTELLNAWSESISTNKEATSDTTSKSKKKDPMVNFFPGIQAAEKDQNSKKKKQDKTKISDNSVYFFKICNKLGLGFADLGT